MFTVFAVIVVLVIVGLILWRVTAPPTKTSDAVDVMAGSISGKEQKDVSIVGQTSTCSTRCTSCNVRRDLLDALEILEVVVVTIANTGTHRRRCTRIKQLVNLTHTRLCDDVCAISDPHSSYARNRRAILTSGTHYIDVRIKFI